MTTFALPQGDPTYNYNWSQLPGGLPQGAVSQDVFDPTAYLRSRPDVVEDLGFTGRGQYSAEGTNPTPTAFDAVYSHYLGRFPDNPQLAFTQDRTFDNTMFRRPGAPSVEEEQAAADRTAAIEPFLDPNTGAIREDLLGGQFTDPNTITPEILAERQALRDQGYLGDFGSGGVPNFLAGFRQGHVDAYGNITPLGYQADEYLNPSFKPGTELTPQLLQPTDEQFLDSSQYTLSPLGPTPVAQAQATAAQAAAKTAAARYDADQVTITDQATMQGQLADLMQQFEGGNIPAWAAPNIRAAEQLLATRGMGASSVAGDALIQAAMEAAKPIAQADAQVYAQALFTNAAANNAARQFNAQSQQQNDQFFANLQTQVSQFNADQQNAIARFNAGEANAMRRFDVQVQNQRDQFNASQRRVIDQSNAEWRRNIDTVNTATTNAANQFNATNLLNISNTAMNNLWQNYRDMANYAFVASESALGRDHSIALQVLANEQFFQRFEAQQQADFSAGLGNLLQNVFTPDQRGNTPFGSFVDVIGGLFD